MTRRLCSTVFITSLDPKMYEGVEYWAADLDSVTSIQPPSIFLQSFPNITSDLKFVYKLLL